MSDDLSQYFTQIKNDTDFFSKAKLIKFLIDEKNLRIIDISRHLDIKPSYVCHILRLNRLPDLIVDGYYSQMISLSHLYIISRLKDQEKMIKVYEEILTKGLTVFQTEERVRHLLHNVETKGKYLTEEEIKNLKLKIQNKYPSSKTSINQSRIKSVIKIELKGSLEETAKNINDIINKLV